MLPFLYASEKLFSEKNGLTLSSLVEARRIELRSILRSCSGSTSLFRDRISEDVGSRTNVELPSPFFLFQSHTDYVL